jgi:hypothetical protein
MTDQSRQAHPNAERGKCRVAVAEAIQICTYVVVRLTSILPVFRALQVFRIEPVNSTTTVESLGTVHGIDQVRRMRMKSISSLAAH